MDGSTEPGGQSHLRLRRPSRLTVAGYAATVATCFVVAGPVGVAAALAVTAGGLLAGPLSAFVVGHVVLLAALPSPTPIQIGIVESGLGLFLLAAVSEERGSARAVGLTAVVFLALVGLLVLTLSAELSLFGVAATLLGVVGAVGYTLHRYELVQLGLVTDEEVGQ